MKVKYLEREFKVLIKKLYKALNIYEEENGIEPSKKKVKKQIDRDTSKDIPFSDFIGLTIRTVEGIIFGLEHIDDSIPTIQDLVRIKNILHDMQYSRGIEEYKAIKRNLFDSCDTVKKLSENV